MLHAGTGEWYEQRHDEPWDMAEDVAPLAPAGWQVALRRALAGADPAPRRVVLDVRELFRLVGQDLGFLVRLAQELEGAGSGIRVVASAGIQRAIRTLQLESRLFPCSTLEEALGLRNPER